MPDIDMSIDGVREAVRRVRADIATQAATTASEFRNTKLPAGSLGPRPAAEAFVEQHNAAHEVYVETIKKVEAELERIADALQASADSAQGVDDRVAEMLIRKAPEVQEKVVERAYLAAVKSDEATLAPGTAADGADGAHEANAEVDREGENDAADDSVTWQ